MTELTEYCMTPDNIATQTARQLMNAFTVKRAEIEDDADAVHKCANCVNVGDATEYPVSEMLVIEKKYKGRVSTYMSKVYYCARHAKQYKPHAMRAGGKTY